MALKPLPLIILIVLLLLVAGGVWFGMTRPAPAPEPEAPEILSFEDCAAAGYPVAESYPQQCATPDGRVFAEELPAPEITYINATADHIRVDTPTPGAVTGKEFEVRGDARGPWFFEASFPIQVLDSAGNVLTTALAAPRDDASWMTEEFVPFSASVTIPEEYIGPATLLLIRDNPSGLPEHDRSISFPITIEY